MKQPLPPENQLASSHLPVAAQLHRSSADSEPPRIPDHELLRRIGGGSYGEVWLARNILGGWRAVKIVYRTSFDHDRPFEREFAGIQKFEPISRAHEGHVDILHVGRNDAAGYFYYVMELADDAAEPPVVSNRYSAISKSIQDHKGTPLNTAALITDYVPKTLKSEMKRRGPLPAEDCVAIGLALTRALAHLHSHGLVHRDIKPSNIIFVDGAPKLADIGLVTGIEATRSFVGTDGYIPPEGPGTPQADFYSLGKVLYEMVTGRDRQDFPELPSEWRTSADRERLLEFNEVVLKACDRDVHQRYASAQQLESDLALLQTGRSVRRLHVVEHRLAIATRAGVALAAVALLAVGAYFGAIRQAQRAQRAERETARQLYVADMSRAYQFFDKGNIRRALDLLEAHRPRPSVKEDLRSFEWFYLWRRCQQDDALYTIQAHRGPVNSLVFSPHGEMFATTSDDGFAVLWDTASREKLALFTNCNEVAFSPDGKVLALAYASNAVTLWDAIARRPLSKLAGENRDYHFLRFTPDGNVLAALEFDDTTVTLWDVASGQVLKTFESAEGGYLYSAAFSPDGKTFVVGHRDNLVTFYDVASWRKTMDLEVPAGFVASLSFSPDSQTLALAGNNSMVVLCDMKSRSVGTFVAHENQINEVVFSRDGQTIASASDDNTFKLWDSSTHQLIFTFKGHLGAVFTVAFSPDGRMIASGCADGTIKLWEVQPKPEADVLIGHTNWARSVAFSPDGKTLASAGKDKTVKLWDVETGRLLSTLEGHQRPVYRLAWSADGRTLASVSGLITEEDGLGEVKLWDPISRSDLTTLTNLNAPVSAVAFSPDGGTLATGNGTGSVMLWNVANRTYVTTLGGHSGLVSALAFSPNGRILASASHDNTVKLRELATRRELWSVAGSATGPTPGGFSIWTITFSPDSRTLAIGNDDGRITLWDFESRKLARTFKGSTGKIYSLAFTSNGRTLIAGTGDGAVTLWHVATGEEITALKGHRGFVESVALSLDGSTLASASADKSVRLWRAATTDIALVKLTTGAGR